MEDNFELEEIKQQWATLQTALNNQKEVNIKLILKDAKRRISWNKALLRTVCFITIFFSIPIIYFVLRHYNFPISLCGTFVLIYLSMAANALYMSSIIQSPNDSNIDILKYSKSLANFKKRYIWSDVIGVAGLIVMIIWAILSMGFDITHPMVMGATIGAAIGLIIGIYLTLRVLGNIKELQNDIELIEDIEN